MVSSSKSDTNEEHSTFCVRTGTSKGVINRMFRTECSRDLGSWARFLVQGSHSVVAAVKEVAWGINLQHQLEFMYIIYFSFALLDCLWHGKEARLYLHFEEGLRLFPSSELTDGEKPSSAEPTPFWKISFEDLRHTADDGVRLLWLDIGSEDGEVVRFYTHHSLKFY